MSSSGGDTAGALHVLDVAALCVPVGAVGHPGLLGLVRGAGAHPRREVARLSGLGGHGGCGRSRESGG